MSKKSTKEKKNSKKSGFKAIHLDKKTIIYLISALCGVLVIIAASAGIHIHKKRIADRTVRIAFYGLSEEITSLLKEKIPQEEDIIIQYDVISDGDFDTSVIKSKYDMLFTWRGEITDTLSASAEDIPAKVLETIPNSLRDKKCVPIILDHCELAYSNEVLKKLGREPSMSFSDYTDFLISAKSTVFSPFFCNGAEDCILIDFIGAIVMAKGGLSAYNKLIAQLRKTESLEDILDFNLDGSELRIRSVLDMLKSWPSEGLTHPSWYNGRGNDLLYFAEDKQLASFFTLLSQHRKIPYNVIKNYESSLVPSNKNASNYGLIAPAVSLMLLSDNSNCKRYAGVFFTEEAQSELSDKTTLAPVHYRAQAYDRQADDVRFWAASCAGGAMPDIYLAVYQRKSKELEKICAEIRSYVR